MVSAASSQYVLQYFSPFSTGHMQAGCAHFPSFSFSAMVFSSRNIRAIRMPGLSHNLRAVFDKNLVTDFFENAERIFETAASATGAGTESGNLAIVVGDDGAIRMLMGSDWPLDSLRAHLGARAAYRVSRSGSQVRVEGKSRTGACLLQSEPVSSVARRLLADPWHRHPSVTAG